MAFKFVLQTPKAEDLQKAFNTEERGSGGNYLEPGRYSVRVRSAEDLVPSTKDATWLQSKVTFEAANGATTNTYLSIPTASPYFNGKLVAFNNLVRFFAALGVAVTLENINEVLNKYFAGPMDRFVGLQVGITLGYLNYFAKYMNGKYALCQNDGQLVMGAPQMDTREALENYCRIQNLAFSKFPMVKSYHTLEGVVNDFSKFDAAEAAAEEPTEESAVDYGNDDDMPFEM